MFDNLDTNIELKRAEMIQAGLTKGFVNEHTIKVSQELDELINLSLRTRKGFNHKKEGLSYKVL